MTNTPASAPDFSALRRRWLSLTGGESGCPRLRFFLSMLLAVTVNSVATHVMNASVLTAGQAVGLGTGVVALPAFIVMLMSSAAAGLFVDHVSLLFRELGVWEQIPLPAIQPDSGFELGVVPGTGLHPLCYFISGLVVMVTGCIIFGLAWRRLRDAGYSPWNLLAGLWAMLMFALYHLLGHGLLGACGDWFLYRLGELWLLWLYCRPGRAARNAA